jgi:gas vesicle protein
MKNIFIALAAGVALGMLLAPDKGSETRKRISGKLGDLSDDISDRAKDLYNQGKRTVSKGKDALTDLQ